MLYIDETNNMVLSFTYNSTHSPLSDTQLSRFSLYTMINHTMYTYYPQPLTLLPKYTECINVVIRTVISEKHTDTLSDAICPFPNNFTIKINNILGSGAEGTAFNVTINNKQYVMKIVFGSYKLINLRNEYKFLFQFMIYTQQRNISLNIAGINPNIPFYVYRIKNANFRVRAFIIKELVSCPIQYKNLMKDINIESNLKFIGHSINDIFMFFMNGYVDILLILEKCINLE